MDPISIAGLASLAAPYVAKGLDALTKSAGEKIGGIIGDLCQSVADKFKGDSYAEQTLARAKEIPDSEERQGAIKSVLAEKMKADPDFAEKVKKLVEEAGKAQAGTVFDQRGLTVYGSQTNIVEARAPVFSGTFSGPFNIVETPKQEPGQNQKESKALLVARFIKLENEIATIEIKNIGQATATNVGISFASRTKEHVCEGRSASIPNSTNIPSAESILIPIYCSSWTEINVDLRWTDNSGKDNKNVSHIILKPI